MARQDANEALLQTSFLYGANAAWIEELQAAYARDPNSVDPEWQQFFRELGEDDALVKKNAEGASWAKPNWPVPLNGEIVSALDGNWGALEKALGEKIQAKAQPGKPGDSAKGAAIVAATGVSVEQATKDSVRAIMLIRAYRMRGHLHAKLDPIGLAPRGDHEELHPQHYGFQESDWDRKIFLDNVLGMEFSTIREIVAILERTYCQTLGVEFMHISDPEEKAWIQERIEGKDKEISFTPEGRRAILNKLIEAEGFEKFLDLKYTGTKRFGLDGSESMVPALEQIIKRGGALGVEEIVLGMAHRGRLNVLTNVMAKPFRAVFHEFKGGSASPAEVEGSGDVKYHLGASSDRAFDDNTVHLSLTANPSHLEIVDPVVLGKVRAKQDQKAKPNVERRKVLPLLIHGDAAFAGQGVVAECFGLSGLKGHRTGGSIHFIINNQIGFTTDPRFSRSSPYPSDVAKMVEAPIFHCNGDDPEAVTFAAKVATEYRQKFGKPVVIDMLCYRRFGHNEGDEPAFTQPKMYQRIRKHPTALETYGKKLVEQGDLTQEQLDARKAEFRSMLESELDIAGGYKPNKADWLDGRWSGFKAVREDVDDPRRGRTGVPVETLRDIATRITTPPPGFHLHRTIQRFFDNRAKAVETGVGIDWATAEALAFGSLLIEGHRVRLSGQDVERGTFSQRHAVVIDQENEQRYTPLNSVREGQASLEVINSMLSEEAVLGFEYGYSLAEPNSLVLWEAQFGDFANGAQVVIDQFISSGERKWLRMSGLVMLLPHGYEGQGPEHSSARLERYLQMCAEDNMQVANCSTPSNYFHILRRQLKRDFRKPLILMTPKSLLRHKRAVSKIEDIAEGSTFHRILWDDAEHDENGVKLVRDDKIRRVVLCSGKVYYDLFEEREKRGVNDVYLMRVEQLYPFPLKALANEMSRFRNAEVVWCQEEPKNMGSWTFVEPYLDWVLGQAGSASKRPRYVGRPASASTAVGLMSKHLAQLQAFLNEALAV
ncbi:2-oxoglutarate dehydrogenase E1 component [Methylorubrum rhodesianum]|uniref:2-oxoglutarate dehydrogenase E1 component n=1 Tax=Methylorubrum rhodesianum TaxID=29427 RepID=A0ABU9ZA96_9HYPH|nr:MULTISPECIES: 2-oxoglutarate dehydrogenase E1 component [Methylorubrum]MBB5763235.1 2-oxoglutarate dehydrogenase E1 component [Methylorubrum rhodesianum]MBI1689037.1 2-oxoglutarate dehydrogenase E1 component [Methylorubrum sp. DB1722]MBK3405890.1 2-oxoglutarate dehydrogenase E1 component [Methylorubrum rhodesianum]MBY0142359.1 2-oxoglutarate dehydrogenase E1 component [Methylorubrum populi]